MTTTPGADELRMRHLLDIARGFTPAPKPPPAADAGDDWWDELYGPDAPDTHPATVRTAPDKARIGGGLIRDWRKGPTADLREPDPGDPDSPDEDEPPEPDQGDDWEETADPDDPAVRRPGAPRNPARTGARLVQATAAGLERRTRWAISTAAGAGLGWFLGLEPLMGGWITGCGHDTGHPGAAILLGVGMVAAGAYAAYRTRLWWPPLAWCCRSPFASALLALCLYAPGVTQ